MSIVNSVAEIDLFRIVYKGKQVVIKISLINPNINRIMTPWNRSLPFFPGLT